MIRNGILFKEKFVIDRTVYSPVFRQSEALAYWKQLSTYITILQVNDWVKTSGDLRKYFSTVTRRAQQFGLLRNLPLEFERATKFINPTEDEIRFELTKHESRSSCPAGLIKTIYKKRWDHLLDERFPTHATQDRDIFYLIKLKSFEDGFQLVKVGVSSFHLGEQRIKKFQKEGYDFEDDPIYWYSLAAVDIERFALNLGKEAPVETKFDGYTEHRLFSQNDFVKLEENLGGNDAVLVLDFSKPPKGYKRVIKKIPHVVKFNDGYAARENRSKQIAVFKTKFDAVLCKGLHLEGGHKRSFAIRMTNFRDTPFWQDETRNDEPPKPSAKKVKKVSQQNPRQFHNSDGGLSELNIPVSIDTAVRDLNKKRFGIHKKDKDKFRFSIKEIGNYFSLIGVNRYGHSITIGTSKYENLIKYFCHHCNINGHDKLMKKYFSEAEKYFTDSFVALKNDKGADLTGDDLEKGTERKQDIERELDEIFSKVFNTLDDLIIKEKTRGRGR